MYHLNDTSSLSANQSHATFSKAPIAFDDVSVRHMRHLFEVFASTAPSDGKSGDDGMANDDGLFVGDLSVFAADWTADVKFCSNEAERNALKAALVSSGLASSRIISTNASAEKGRGATAFGEKSAVDLRNVGKSTYLTSKAISSLFAISSKVCKVTLP